jgi:hypothetical protein
LKIITTALKSRIQKNQHVWSIKKYIPKIGENVILSFLAVADSVKIPLKMNNSTNTTFIAKMFY